MKSLRVLIVAAHYPPQNTSCAHQMSDLAEEFIRQGHRVLVTRPLRPWPII